jgi:hypothetical protein
MRARPSAILAAAAALLAAWPVVGARRLLPTDTAPAWPIRGATLAPIEDGRLGPVGYGTALSELAIEELADLPAGWISLTPFGRMDDLDSTDILHDFEIPVEENEERIRRTALAVRAHGMRVALIPHLWVVSGQWRGRIDPGSEDGWRQWFDAYEEFLLRFARLAAGIEADLFSVGVEFASSTNDREERWRELIARVREVYPGPLTYSANWDEVEWVPFWDALDVVGVNAFWPLAARPGERHEAMLARAEAVAGELAGLAFHFNRHVIFTEFGVKSATDSALAPWEWPEHCGSLADDEAYQAEAYEAVLEAFAGRPWFGGLFVWKYFSDPWDGTQEPRAGFGVRGKAAEEVLARWYGADWDDAALDLLPPL